MIQRVLVLGGNGFIGRRVVASIARSGRAKAVAGIRRVHALPAASPDRDFDVVSVDAAEPTSLRHALRGIDRVVNCLGGSPRAMAESFRLLCEAARLEGVASIVHLSSMAVYGGREGLVDETASLDGSLGAYAMAKIACEIHAETLAANGGPGIVILRPSCVFGPGSRQWTLRIGDLLRSRRIGDLGLRGDGACNLAFIDDVAAAVLAALERPAAGRHTFNVSSPEIPSWNEFFVEFGCAIGAAPLERISDRWLDVETRALAPVLKLSERAAGWLRLGDAALPPAIPPSLATLWRQDIRLDHRAADTALGFPRTPLDEGIAAAARWFVEVRGTSKSFKSQRSFDAMQQ